MNARTLPILPVIGTLMPDQGGYFAGILQIDGVTFGQVLAPKAEGELTGIWFPRYEEVPGTTHCGDGLANTTALAAAGSELATKVRALRIAGFDDWHMPARDQLELLYRHLKPSTEETDGYFRDGDNPSSVPPGFPYTIAQPVQTSAQLFRAGEAEAFEEEWYWSSTQYSRFSAWCQRFDGGNQNGSLKANEFRVRALRRFVLA